MIIKVLLLLNTLSTHKIQRKLSTILIMVKIYSFANQNIMKDRKSPKLNSQSKKRKNPKSNNY